MSFIEKQRALLLKLLRCDQNASDLSTDKFPSWKVLVVDDITRSIITPILTAPDLLREGITLILDIKTRRQSIPASALFFVTPTPQNMKEIITDVQRGTYQGYHLAFLGTVEAEALKSLAKTLAALNVINRVKNIFEIHNSLISIQQGLFVSSQPQSKQAGSTSTDFDAVYSYIQLTGQKPVISHMGKQARELANKLNTAISQSSSLVDTPGTLVLLADRCTDLSAVLSFPFTYGGLVWEMGMTERDGRRKGGAQKRLNHQDKLFTDTWCESFSTTAEAIKNALSSYKHTATDISAERLESVVDSLPEITKSKEECDRHADLAAAVLNNISVGELHKLHLATRDLRLSRPAQDLAKQLCSDTLPWSPEHRARAVLAYALSHADAVTALAASEESDGAVDPASLPGVGDLFDALCSRGDIDPAALIRVASALARRILSEFKAHVGREFESVHLPIPAVCYGSDCLMSGSDIADLIGVKDCIREPERASVPIE
eukprot:gnl/Dysnectes_brevis/3654_a4666_812.p1 GENE.gnl/Dysnectes_brevis/3654_a4666_812~~gnl/Dysnectes_brevis/3654_a4666_812.p1  ORF type:complete len:491 (+),score=128.65 gnl/Dysnectes_brevis/3654_a4666_812:58-1530(+)